MTLKSLYKDYFQKSKIFLYPHLEIRRGVSITPIQTYVGLKDHYSPEDMKLICLYYTRSDPEFTRFEKNKLIGNKYFVDFKQIKGDSDKQQGAYVFDFQHLASDWNKFLIGKYSQFTLPFKNRIKEYYGKENPYYHYIDSYLNPENYYDEYSKLLDVPVKHLKECGELCSPPNFDKEISKLETILKLSITN